ncbi:MAG: hypothetical protein FWD69_11230 [Polyangiaceae bacterium]|nr:hypothetical protein [Polyangiaceae bacterium]
MNFARSFRAVAVSVVLAIPVFTVAACGDGTAAKTANVTPGPMPAGESWTGVYYHPIYGYLHLVEQGSSVVGRWKSADQSRWGELSGRLSGNVLHYTWKEHKIGMVGASASTHGKGYFIYTLDAEKRPVLEGQFGLKDEEAGSDWRSVKQARMLPDLKSIGGDAEGAPQNGF